MWRFERWDWYRDLAGDDVCAVDNCCASNVLDHYLYAAAGAGGAVAD